MLNTVPHEKVCMKVVVVHPMSNLCLCKMNAYAVLILGVRAFSRMFYTIKFQGFLVNHHKQRNCVQPSKDSFQGVNFLYSGYTCLNEIAIYG